MEGRSIELTEEMAAIIDRLRGQLSRERLVLLLLQIADTGAVSSPPEDLMKPWPPPAEGGSPPRIGNDPKVQP